MTRERNRVVVFGSLVLAAVLTMLCCGLGLVVVDWPFKSRVAEALRHETPEAHIRAFLSALERGDQAAAEGRWALPDWELSEGRSGLLAERRQQVIEELSAGDLQLDSYKVLETEWWRTCCEPGVVNDSRSAGGARVRVQLLDSAGMPRQYTFDVFTLGGAYWGAAEGWPARRWALRDVYPTGEEPLFWRWVWEPQVRYLE